MTKNPPSYLFWDWKSIVRICLIFLIITAGLCLYLFYPDWKRNQTSKNYIQETTAEIIDFSTKEYISMSETGNEIIVYSFHITYQFVVNEREYTSTDQIANNIQNYDFINRLQDRDENMYYVKYNPDNPDESQLITE